MKITCEKSGKNLIKIRFSGLRVSVDLKICQKQEELIAKIHEINQVFVEITQGNDYLPSEDSLSDDRRVCSIKEKIIKTWNAHEPECTGSYRMIIQGSLPKKNRNRLSDH